MRTLYALARLAELAVRAGDVVVNHLTAAALLTLATVAAALGTLAARSGALADACALGLSALRALAPVLRLLGVRILFALSHLLADFYGFTAETWNN